MKSKFSKTGWAWRFAVSIVLDITDFTIGRVPGIGTAFDAVLGIIGVALWGPVGALQFGELLDVTDQLDASIPTLTLSGLILYIKERWGA